MQRRAFLASALAAAATTDALARVIQSADAKASSPPRPRDDSAARRLGWELGTQAWTFRDRTCFEAIDTARLLGLTCIELFPGQQMTRDSADVKVGPGLTSAQKSELKGKLASAGVRAHSFGVVSPGSDEKALREIFDFVREMGMVGIACEPVMAADDRPGPAWKLVDKLTAEYGLYAACHNHPKPSTYWDPQIVLDAEKEFTNPRVGACADTGHWTRSGLSAVECLKKYQGRIFELHFKDVKDNIDHPWGTGAGEARGQMAELKRQGFKGAVFVEYEHGSGKELEANVGSSIEFFDKVAGELG